MSELRDLTPFLFYVKNSAHRQKKTALVVFAREPRKGKVKTRLARALAEDDVFRLYRAFLRDILATARRVGADGKFIYYTGARDPVFLKRHAKDFDFVRQKGRTLGARMRSAFAGLNRRGYGRIVIIGSDCLTVRPADIKQALQKLGTRDCVLGPSEDGGYYLIGLSRPARPLFQGVDWGTGQVFRQTRAKLKNLNFSTYFLAKKADIDTMKSLQSYARMRPFQRINRETARALKRISTRFRG